MSTVVLVGAQWGDEGKGKLTDYMAEEADVVVRYQGGNNAGHTVVTGGREFKLHLVPSGILHPEKVCVIGNGVVIDPAVLRRELEMLGESGWSLATLYISERAHLIMPYHRRLDELEEENRNGCCIGTTRRGIGPAYTDKYARDGIRMVDLLEKDAQRLKKIVARKCRFMEKLYDSRDFNPEEVVREYLGHAAHFRPYVRDTSLLVYDAVQAGRNVLFEGAQGTLLDVDHGTYPYVTSSNPTAAAAAVGSGVGPRVIDHVIGVTKAYTTRVGEGPFPTELEDGTGQCLRQAGREFGTTTGRPRRCGWLDAVVLRYAARVNGLDYLAVTKLDVLSGLPMLRICRAYNSRGREIRDFPSRVSDLAEYVPVYEELPGWSEDLTGVRSLNELPGAARGYLERLSELAGVPVGLVSVGPGREQTLALIPPFGR
ncbi:MAG: adenylosuccinate synthase [Candidatus Desulforudis sp.]|nr:adenylosuccinate synthase [Desulforudis sp.]